MAVPTKRFRGCQETDRHLGAFQTTGHTRLSLDRRPTECPRLPKLAIRAGQQQLVVIVSSPRVNSREEKGIAIRTRSTPDTSCPVLRQPFHCSTGRCSS